MAYRAFRTILATGIAFSFTLPVCGAANDAPDVSVSPAPVHNELLEKARAANGDLYAALKSFVCHEDIHRFKGNLKGAKVRPIDRVTASLSFENGTEHYSEIHQNTRTVDTMSQIAGAWSEGEYGTLLQQTQKLLTSQTVSFVSFDVVGSAQTAIYNFQVTEQQSPWDLLVGDHHYRIPFDTKVWISVQSGEILKIARTSTSIPSETRISEIGWGVTLDSIELSGKKWLLPIAADYAVSYNESNRKEWNQMSFSEYRRYGSESVLKFN